MDLADNIFVSTCLVPKPVPKLGEWWYYMLSSGQHVSFDTEESLQILAKRFNRHVISSGPYHLFSREPKSKTLFRLATYIHVARAVSRILRRKSLQGTDFIAMTS